MIISIASGKGGTGKTTVSASLALSLMEAGKDVQFLDCDVEEPNAHIFLKPDIQTKEEVFIPVPKINDEKCSYCGKCRDVCAYKAIAVIPPKEDRNGLVLPFWELCHGCGACSYFCPTGAIEEIGYEIGFIESGQTSCMEFIQGRLNIGATMSPPLIREMKRRIDKSKTVIIDAPPGTSCPVIETIKESDYCLLITEPTPFGLNDLTLAVEVVRKIGIPFGVFINRADLGDDKTEQYCKNENIPILMRIPFKKDFAAAYSTGKPMVDAFPEYNKKFQKLFARISQ